MVNFFHKDKQESQIVYIAEAFYQRLRLSPKKILDNWDELLGKDFDGIPPCPTMPQIIEICQILCLDGDILPDVPCFEKEPERMTYHSCRLEQEIAKLRGGEVQQQQHSPIVYG